MSFKRVKLRYTDVDTPSLTFTSGSTTVVYQKYNLNSPFDVNTALGSTAMPGYAEWAAIYDQYMVTYCKITATFALDNGTPPIYVGVVFRPVYNETNWSSWKNWMELAGNPLPHKRKLMSCAGGNKAVCTVSVGCPLWRLIGNKQEYFGSGSWTQVTTANPSRIIEGFVYALSANGATYTSTILVPINVKVDMWIKFYNKKTLVA